MSKPRDPVLAVLRYFETAELPLARQALALATQIVRQRSPSKPGSKPKRSKRREEDVPLPLTN